MNNQRTAQPHAAQRDDHLSTIRKTYLQLLTSDQLAVLLKEVEARLGTVLERNDDLHRARIIAHELSNTLTVVRIARELGATPPDGFPSFSS